MAQFICNFTNLHVDAHNVSRLDLLPGERESFTAIDTGDLRGLNCPAPQMSYFKSGAPVIVLYNINEIIHNGTRGTFVRKLDENTAVINVGGGEYVIQKISWTNVNEDGHSIGSRLQMPLKLHWASTIHKSQGLTLEKVVVHSAYEFTGGLLYTAFSRVRSINDVQVLDFNKKHVCKRNQELNELNNLPNNNIVNCPCFKEMDRLSLGERPINPQDISDEELLQIVQEMFDDQESNTEEQSERLVSMEEVLEMVEENEHILSKPPEDFDMKMFLESFKGQSVPGEESNFGHDKNAAVDLAVRNIDHFSALVQIVWHKIFVLLQKHLTENIQDIVFSQKELKEFYQQSLDISRTLEYRGWLKECFQTPESTLLKPAEISIGFDIVLGVFHNTLHIVGESVRAKSRDDMVSTFSVKQMDDVGKGKVRFVAAWAVSRVLQKAKKYVRDNLYTASSATRSQVNKCLHKIEVIESIVVIPYGILFSETKYPGTLEVTESRQYRTHGLIHVSDQFFEFALELEQKRMNGLNSRMLKMATNWLKLLTLAC